MSSEAQIKRMFKRVGTPIDVSPADPDTWAWQVDIVDVSGNKYRLAASGDTRSTDYTVYSLNSTVLPIYTHREFTQVFWIYAKCCRRYRA